jgi:hypothetical protein
VFIGTYRRRLRDRILFFSCVSSVSWLSLLLVRLCYSVKSVTSATPGCSSSPLPQIVLPHGGVVSTAPRARPCVFPSYLQPSTFAFAFACRLTPAALTLPTRSSILDILVNGSFSSPYLEPHSATNFPLYIESVTTQEDPNHVYTYRFQNLLRPIPVQRQVRRRRREGMPTQSPYLRRPPPRRSTLRQHHGPPAHRQGVPRQAGTTVRPVLPWIQRR